MTQRIRNQRGTALIETAITIPIVLLICVAIFEFGRAYQTWQVLTNASREGARIAVINGTSDQQISDAVHAYLVSGRLTDAASAQVGIDRNVPMTIGNGSSITVSYPFSFMVLNPVARLVVRNSSAGNAPLTMQAVTLMRNEN